jgi:aminopeptidase N
LKNFFKPHPFQADLNFFDTNPIIALKKAPVGPRSTVWSEKELLDACVHEFSEDTEKFIKAGEKITGIPYEWGAYDLVVLPGAFPYGGMENPQVRIIHEIIAQNLTAPTVDFLESLVVGW